MACGEWGYANDGCRCSTCTEAHRRQMRLYRERKRTLLSTSPESVPHGTLNGYQNYGCRCDDCKDARAAYFNRRTDALSPLRE